MPASISGPANQPQAIEADINFETRSKRGVDTLRSADKLQETATSFPGLSASRDLNAMAGPSRWTQSASEVADSDGVGRVSPLDHGYDELCHVRNII